MFNFNALLNVWKIGELRTKILFTLAMLAVYRIGYWIPLPGVNQEMLQEHFLQAIQNESAAGRAASYIALFSGAPSGTPRSSAWASCPTSPRRSSSSSSGPSPAA